MATSRQKQMFRYELHITAIDPPHTWQPISLTNQKYGMVKQRALVEVLSWYSVTNKTALRSESVQVADALRRFDEQLYRDMLQDYAVGWQTYDVGDLHIRVRRYEHQSDVRPDTNQYTPVYICEFCDKSYLAEQIRNMNPPYVDPVPICINCFAGRAGWNKLSHMEDDG